MPIAQTDIVQTLPNTPLMIDVLANDSGDELTIIGVSNPAFGAVSPNSDGTLTYTPNNGFEGTDTFSYTIEDDLEQKAQGLVSVTVAPINAKPDAKNDSVLSIAGQATAINILANDTDPDGDTLALTALGAPGHGTVSVNQDQTVRYQPEEGYIGLDSFSYTVGDGRGLFDTATVNINIQRRNHDPEASDDVVATTKDESITFNVLANDNDVDGDDLVLVGLSLPAHGRLSVNGDFSFTYTPEDGFVGQDSCAYTIGDGRNGLNSATVLINVADVNSQPVAINDTAQTTVNKPVNINILDNDSDADSDQLTIVGITIPIHGTVALNADRSLAYTPKTGFIGDDEFSYTIDDGRGGKATATVFVEVEADPTPTTFNNGYSYRRRIAIPSALVQGDEDLINFPLFIRENHDWLRSAANGGRIENGTHLDIRFEALDGTKLDHELEHYDPASGALNAWVRVPVLAFASVTVFYCYYGKSSVAFDEANPDGVWRDYLAVYHLPGGEDRTGNGRDLTPSGLETGQLLGDAGVFNGATSVMSQGDAAWLDGHTQLSAQMWVKSEEDSTDNGLIALGPINGQDDALGFGIRYDAVGFSGGGSRVLTVEQAHADGRSRIESASGVQTTNEQAISVVWRAGEFSKIYIDGLPNAPTFTGTVPRSGLTSFANGTLHVGAGAKDSTAGGWHGLIDEVRFRKEALSEAWISVEHRNQRDPQAFYGLGGEDAFGSADQAPVALPEWKSTDQDTSVEIDVLANDFDPDSGDSLAISSVGTPAGGTATIADGKISYAPNAGFSGRDRFSYIVNSGGKASSGYVLVDVRAGSTGAGGGAANDDLPYSGLFYGCATCGVTPSNWRYRAAGYAQRFRCERTGQINKVRWWNKYDNNRQGYHTGDGGVIRVEVHADNGSGWPSGTVLGKSADISAPTKIGVFPIVTISPAVPVTKGERYHIVYRQLNSSRGTISVNENLTYIPDSPLSPWFKDDLASLKPTGSGWEERPGHHAVFEVHYTDGIVKGQGYLMGYRNDRRFINGSQQIRQRFVVQDFQRVVEAVHIRLHRTSTTGRNLTMKLKNSAGTTMETIIIPESEISLDPYNDSRTSRDNGLATQWLKKDFASSHTLGVGSTYYLELTASSGASYVILPQQDGKRSGWGFVDDKLEPGETRAEYSTNSGSSWRGASFFEIDNRNDLDYPFLFELA